MDEPYGAVDPINLEVIKKIIIDLQKKGVSVLITDHNASNVLSIVDRCCIINAGSIITSGSSKEIIHDQKEVDTLSLLTNTMFLFIRLIKRFLLLTTPITIHGMRNNNKYL